MAVSPAAELRRINKRISELQTRQRELIVQMNLDETAEAVILRAMDAAETIHRMTDGRRPTHKEATTIYRRLERHVKAVDRLDDSPARDAAKAALHDAVETALERFLGVPAS